MDDRRIYLIYMEILPRQRCEPHGTHQRRNQNGSLLVEVFQQALKLDTPVGSVLFAIQNQSHRSPVVNLYRHLCSKDSPFRFESFCFYLIDELKI